MNAPALRVIAVIAMFLRSRAQSHFYDDMDHIDSEDDKIAMMYVTAAKLDSIKERWVGDRNRKKQYAFVLHLEWSDGSSSIIWRSYNDFFDFQCGLLDSFPEEAGSVREFKRIIPYLPGRKIFRKSDLALAEERKPDVENYVETLIKLPPKISQSSILVSFFQRRQTDPEWFQQFPQGINRLGDDHVDNIDSRTGIKIIKGEQVIQDTDLLYEEDIGKDSYLNPTFEASVSL